jgi:hypothetical protein
MPYPVGIVLLGVGGLPSVVNDAADEATGIKLNDFWKQVFSESEQPRLENLDRDVTEILLLTGILIYVFVLTNKLRFDL